MNELILRPPEQCSSCGDSALHHTGYTGYARWWLSRKSLCSRCLNIRAAQSQIRGFALGIVTTIVAIVTLLLVYVQVFLRPTLPPPTPQIAAPTLTQGATPVGAQGSNVVPVTTIPPQTPALLTGSPRPDQHPLSEQSTTIAPADPSAQPNIQTSSSAQPALGNQGAHTTHVDTPRSNAVSATPIPSQSERVLTGSDRPDGHPPSPAQSSTIGTTEQAAQVNAPHTNVTPAKPEQSTTSQAPPFSAIVEVVAKDVKGISRHAQPIGTLTALRAPEAARSYMSDRCVVLTVTISGLGEAQVSVADRGGIAELYVQRAVRDVSRPWTPARDGSGKETIETRSVRYCW